MTNAYVWEESKNKPEGFFDMSLLLHSILFLYTVTSGLSLVAGGNLTFSGTIGLSPVIGCMWEDAVMEIKIRRMATVQIVKPSTLP
jgi:hypothetical protein